MYDNFNMLVQIRSSMKDLYCWWHVCVRDNLLISTTVFLRKNDFFRPHRCTSRRWYYSRVPQCFVFPIKNYLAWTLEEDSSMQVWKFEIDLRLFFSVNRKLFFKQFWWCSIDRKTNIRYLIHMNNRGKKSSKKHCWVHTTPNTIKSFRVSLRHNMIFCRKDVLNAYNANKSACCGH